MLPQTLEERPVAEMNAVKGTDRDGASPVACAQVPESTNEPHERKAAAAARIPEGSIGKFRLF